MKRVPMGRSAKGQLISAFVFGLSNQPRMLVLGGFHGDEPKSVSLSLELVASVARDRNVPRRRCLVVVPVVNPDGYDLRKRRNARGVDINRNFPTQNWTVGHARSRMFGGVKPASEPETRAVIRAVERYLPEVIISVHSISGHRFCNNYDGPAREIARRLARKNGYPVRGSIGYPTPGSLGTWAGIERGIATITLELPSHHSPQRCGSDNIPALLNCVDGEATVRSV